MRVTVTLNDGGTADMEIPDSAVRAALRKCRGIQSMFFRQRGAEQVLARLLRRTPGSLSFHWSAFEDSRRCPACGTSIAHLHARAKFCFGLDCALNRRKGTAR